MATINKVLRGLTPLTAKSIRKFIGSKEAEKGIGWFTNKELDKIFDDEKNSISLHEKLKNIQQEFEDTQFITSMNKKEGTDMFSQAEMDICRKFQFLQTILVDKNSKDKRECKVKWLRYGILDSKYGVLSNLSVIHQELVGQTKNADGLLEIWYQEVCNRMNENPISAKTCYDILMKHLTKAAILQLKGFLLLKAANNDFSKHVEQIETLKSNLRCQHISMDTIISDTMKYLADPSKDNEFYIRKDSGVRFKPFVKSRGEKKTLIDEYFLKYIADEKWIFEKSSRFNEDGSLFISGSRYRNGGKGCYLSLQDQDKAICVSKIADAQPFFVMPIDKENRTTITICKWKSESWHFLGNSLRFITEKDNIEFTMTKPEDTPKKEHSWDDFYKLKKPV